MKIAEINTVSYGSTGKIMLQLADLARDSGCKVETFSPVLFSKASLFQKKKTVRYLPGGHRVFGIALENVVHRCIGTILGNDGCYSVFSTQQLIRQIDAFKPDILHLHNLHGFCFNLPILFRYIEKNNIKVVWTLHDCWTFTGHCPYFTMVKCNKWKEGCNNCPQPRIYPKMYLDSSKKMYELKKKLFCKVQDMTLVTPSQWLGGLVKQSFMKNYPLRVINNGIDLDVFKPSPGEFRNKYHIEDKYIVLGVSMAWGKRKGLDVMVEIANRLDSRFQVVLVGTTEAIDKNIPDWIITIHRTDSQEQLAEIYSAADVFVNPIREENFPTVNIESLACGTPVITFDTGGSSEIIDINCGVVVDCDDIDALEQKIVDISEKKPFSENDCRRRSEVFDNKKKYQEYIELYNSIVGRDTL